MKSWLRRIFDKKDRSNAPPRRCAARRHRVVLRLEELESRLVPSAMVQFSTGAETVNASAGTFSIPVTLTGAPAPTITTFASGFNFPAATAFDAAGNLYVANNGAGTVSKVTPAGTVSTFASGLNGPAGLAFDAAGNLYVSNNSNGTVSKVTPAGTVSTFATGFNNPGSLAIDAAGNLYVNNESTSTVSKVTLAGMVSTFASGFSDSAALAFSGGNLYVGSLGTDTVSKVTPAGVVSTFASGFAGPEGLALDAAGNLYVANYGDGSNNGTMVSEVTPAGVVSTFATGFSGPDALAFDAAGNLYVANSAIDTVSKVSETVTAPFTLGGTAVSGTDYSGVTASPLTFGIGQTTENITGTLLPDPGASKTLTVTLGTPTNATLGSPAANTLTITEGTAQTADQRFISNFYTDLLHRQVDAGGLANWTGLLAQGVSRDQVVLDIERASGHEFYQVEVQSAFQQYLRRAADPSGLNSFTNYLAAGNTVEQMDGLIVTSPEFLNIQGGGTYQGFLNALYQDALGRAIDSSGQQSFGNGTPAATAAAVLSSNEYHTDLVIQDYANLLDRGVDPADQAWINELNMGIRDEVVIASIISDPGGEYYNKTAS
jgi:sugar lactone lactonase YvrE